MAKLFANEIAEEVTSEGIQILGDNSYTTDYPMRWSVTGATPA